MRLALAAFLDRQEERLRRLAEHVGYAPWLEEFKLYTGDPRLTLGEFWHRYYHLREEAQPQFAAVTTEPEAREFYRTSQYPMWRNLVHRRHSAWRRVLWTMRGKRGEFLEFGCGVAPIVSWVAAHRWPRDGWHYMLVDINGPALQFARSRIRQQMLSFVPEAYWIGPYNVITTIEVFEHLPNPERTARDLVGRLAPGGFLHWNFVSTENTQLDLATPAQREETITYLKSTLRTVYEADGYVVGRKA